MQNIYNSFLMPSIVVDNICNIGIISLFTCVYVDFIRAIADIPEPAAPAMPAGAGMGGMM